MTLSFSCSFGRRQDDLISSSVPSTTSTPTVTSAAGLQKSLLSSTSTTTKITTGSSSAGTQSRWVTDTLCVQAYCVLMYVHAFLFRRLGLWIFSFTLLKSFINKNWFQKVAVMHVWGNKLDSWITNFPWITLLKIQISLFDSSGWAFWFIVKKRLALYF